jgi:hypothetical protein
MKSLLSLILLLSSFALLAQKADSTKPSHRAINPAMIHYQGEEKLTKDITKEIKTFEPWDSLMLQVDDRIELLSKSYFESKKIRGYKIQIFSGNSRFEATKVKSDFISKFRDAQPPELMYQTPNFKLRVGNYRHRLKAQEDLLKFKEEFPSAFLVNDEIVVSFED